MLHNVIILRKRCLLQKSLIEKLLSNHFSTSNCRNNVTYIEPAELRLNRDYQYYYLSWTRAILLAFIPFVLLLILNGKIICNLRHSQNPISSRVSPDEFTSAKKSLHLCINNSLKNITNFGEFSTVLYFQD